MDALTIFKNRLKRVGIEIELSGNYPWIYLTHINGKRVTEKYLANHGFTIGFTGVKFGSKFEFSELNEIFKLIRKYR